MNHNADTLPVYNVALLKKKSRKSAFLQNTENSNFGVHRRFVTELCRKTEKAERQFLEKMEEIQIDYTSNGAERPTMAAGQNLEQIRAGAIKK